MRAMESGVEEVMLMLDVALDIGFLIEYSGQGKCRQVNCHHDWYANEQLRTWATSKHWELTYDWEGADYLFFLRKSTYLT